MSSDFISIDQITVIGEQVPVGKYKARLLDATGEMSKSSNKPMIIATWEITQGEHEMKETRSLFPLSVTLKKDKKGTMRTYAGGIADLAAAVRAVNGAKLLPAQWPVEPTLEFAQQTAVALKKVFGNKNVDIAVMPNNYERTEDDGTVTQVNGTRTKVVGVLNIATPAAASTGAAPSTNRFADLA